LGSTCGLWLTILELRSILVEGLGGAGQVAFVGGERSWSLDLEHILAGASVSIDNGPVVESTIVTESRQLELSSYGLSSCILLDCITVP
jgi:hypothetical protein